MRPAVPDSSGLRRILTWPADLLRGTVRKSPATLSFVALFWILGALTSSLAAGPDPPVLDWVSVSAESLPWHWPALVLSALWANSLAGYVAGTVLALVIGLPVERFLGTRRFLLAAVGTQLAGALLAIGFALACEVLFGSWGRELTSESFLGPVAALCGAAAAASAGFGALWRRRLRVFLFTLLSILALYSGSFQDVLALGAALAGAVGGPLLFRRRPRRPSRLVTSRREARVLVAIIVAASAAGPVLAALNAHAVGPLSVLRYLFTNVEATDPQSVAELCADPGMREECSAARFELGAGPAGFFLATLPQVLLLVFSDGLRRGRRFAWLAALVLQGAMTVAAAFRIARFLAGDPEGERYEFGAPENPLALILPMAVPLLVLILLAANYRLFTVRAPSGTYRRIGVATLSAALLLAGLYVGGGLLFRSGFTPDATAETLFQDLPRRFLPVQELRNTSPALLPESVPTFLLYEGVGVLFWLFVCVLLLRSFIPPAQARGSGDVEAARDLLKTYGGSTMAWMTLWNGNSYWFSASGRSYIAYRLNFGVALTVGDPVGPAADARATIEGFAAHCTETGNTACFYSINAGSSSITSELGFSRLQVAEETVLPLGTREFKGRKFQDIRTAMNRAAKAGIHSEWTTYAAAPLAVLDQLHAISEEWVAEKQMPEMGFTLGGLEELEDPEVRVLLAVDEDRTVHAVTSWLPVYRDGKVVGWTLDFMRRRSEGFPAAMDFLIASATLSLQAEGCEFLSLSGAPLARAGGVLAPAGATAGRDPAGNAPADNGVSVMDRVLDRLGSTLEPVYGFRSLLAFKAKFQPEYVPLYMAYRDPASLPAIGNAVARAYVPRVSVGQGLVIARRIVGNTP